MTGDAKVGPLNLFVIRHAIAAPGSPASSDAERPLTQEGRDRFALEVRGFAALGILFDTLYHSPMVRAAETAELLAPVVRGELVPTLGLACAPAAGLLELLRADACVAFVGHEPWSSELVAWLVTGRRQRGDAFRIKKGGVVWLRGEPRPARMALRAALPPRVLRALGQTPTR